MLKETTPVDSSEEAVTDLAKVEEINECEDLNELKDSSKDCSLTNISFLVRMLQFIL